MKTIYLHIFTKKGLLAMLVSMGLSYNALSQNPVDYTLQASDVTIEEGVITACSYNFEGNADGTNLTIPDNLGVTALVDAEIDWFGNITGKAPFVNKNITQITLPSTLLYIGNFSLSQNNITQLSLPAQLESIGRDAFAKNKLDSVFIPQLVYSIGSNCFYNNPNLRKVIFAPNSHLVSIGSHAFVETMVESIILPEPVVSDNNFEYWIRIDDERTRYAGGETVIPGNNGFIAKYFHTLTADELVIDNGIITGCSYNFCSKFIIIPSEINGNKIT